MKKDSKDSTKIVLFESELEKEAAKVAGAIIGRTADGIMDAGANIFGGLLGDAIREWRTRNLIRRLARTAEILKGRGVALDKAKALPMGEAYAMFEEASKQDDPTIAEMWSALLANAMDSATDVRVDPAFVATLRVIGGVEARILRFVREFQKEQAAAIASMPKNSIILNRTKVDLERSRKRDEQRRAIDEAFNLRSKEILKSHLDMFDQKAIERGLATLVKERCIYVPAPTFSRHDLTSTSEIGRIEMLDENKVRDALDEISGSIDEHSGRPDMLPDLLNTRPSMIESHYDLTDFGKRLLFACEAPSGPIQD